MTDLDAVPQGKKRKGEDGSDGPVVLHIKDDTEEGEIISINFGGTSWLNNLSNTVTPSPDANQWAQFPWEFPQLFFSPNEQLRIISEFMWWKAESVEVCFSNCQNYIQINTGAVPTVVPTTNGKFCVIRDDEYLVNIGSCPFGASYADTYIEGPINDTLYTLASGRTNFYNLMESWKQGGYFQDQIKYMFNGVNTMAYQVRGLGTGVTNTGTYVRVMNPSHPNCKTMSMGQGRCIEEKWNFKNKHWRCTGEFASDPLWIIPNTPVVINNAGLFSIRADEWQGWLMNARENSFRDNTAGYPIFVPPQVNQNLLATLQFNPTWFLSSGSVPLVVGPLPNGADGIYRPNFLPPINTSRPQPRLLLHIVPDIGVLGSSGQSNCSFDFKITWRIRVKRKPLQHGSTDQSGSYLGSALTNIPGPMMAPTNVIPYFLPTYSVA